MRARVSRDPNFDKFEAFKFLDINKDGIVTEKELSKVLRYRNFYSNELELKVLMKKLDKDQDGQVSYDEFADELRPRNLYA